MVYALTHNFCSASRHCMKLRKINFIFSFYNLHIYNTKAKHSCQRYIQLHGKGQLSQTQLTDRALFSRLLIHTQCTLWWDEFRISRRFCVHGFRNVQCTDIVHLLHLG